MISRLLQALIRGYQIIISPLNPNCCRFSPSCSRYSLDAIKTHGFVRGSWLALKRMTRCHPWGGEGFDPVPLPKDEKTLKRPSSHS